MMEVVPWFRIGGIGSGPFFFLGEKKEVLYKTYIFIEDES